MKIDFFFVIMRDVIVNNFGMGIYVNGIIVRVDYEVDMEVRLVLKFIVFRLFDSFVINLNIFLLEFKIIYTLIMIGNMVFGVNYLICCGIFIKYEEFRILKIVNMY